MADRPTAGDIRGLPGYTRGYFTDTFVKPSPEETSQLGVLQSLEAINSSIKSFKKLQDTYVESNEQKALLDYLDGKENDKPDGPVNLGKGYDKAYGVYSGRGDAAKWALEIQKEFIDKNYFMDDEDILALQDDPTAYSKAVVSKVLSELDARYQEDWGGRGVWAKVGAAETVMNTKADLVSKALTAVTVRSRQDILSSLRNDVLGVLARPKMTPTERKGEITRVIRRFNEFHKDSGFTRDMVSQTVISSLGNEMVDAARNGDSARMTDIYDMLTTSDPIDGFNWLTAVNENGVPKFANQIKQFMNSARAHIAQWEADNKRVLDKRNGVIRSQLVFQANTILKREGIDAAQAFVETGELELEDGTRVNVPWDVRLDAARAVGLLGEKTDKGNPERFKEIKHLVATGVISDVTSLYQYASSMSESQLESAERVINQIKSVYDKFSREVISRLKYHPAMVETIRDYSAKLAVKFGTLEPPEYPALAFDFRNDFQDRVDALVPDDIALVDHYRMIANELYEQYENKLNDKYAEFKKQQAEEQSAVDDLTEGLDSVDKRDYTDSKAVIDTEINNLSNSKPTKADLHDRYSKRKKENK